VEIVNTIEERALGGARLLAKLSAGQKRALLWRSAILLLVGGATMRKVSFLGYGRFGAALGGLLAEAGLSVRGLDPYTHVPDEVRAASIDDLVAFADLIVVAVPVKDMPRAFEALRPVLSASQTVIDVGSVKAGPAQGMAAVFGGETPWVATHPLFGPTSLARGERPLRVVVCPNPMHPSAVQRVTALFERIGCEVMEQDPAEHDRAMAYTHALAFFLAKGLLDAGVPTFAPYAPPSFQAIARTIELIRGDAGHLFEALHTENTYAAEARRRLLDALDRVDQDLLPLDRRPGLDGLPSRGPESSQEAFAIPDLGARSPELRETRELIDDIDQELIDLLARRALLSRRAAHAKAELGHGVRDPVREARLREERRRWASARGLDPASIDEIFQAILGFSRRVQQPPEGGAL
jgi:prephenate dehydrogenase